MQTEHSKEKGPEKEKLHIFINKIKFDEDDGVKPSMLGGELADLVSVPRENARITRKLENPLKLTPIRRGKLTTLAKAN